MKSLISYFSMGFFILFTHSAKSSPLYGHSLSPTIETNKKGEVSIGSYVASVGLSDEWMLASSTWMYYDYNTWSVILKKKFESSAIQMAYLKSHTMGSNFYVMEAFLAWFIKKFEVNSNYEISLNLNYMHFIDETVPFSFRREPGNNLPYQYSLSSLHRLKWSKNFGGLLEFGILGLNYNIPEAHSGFGFYYQNSWTLVQLGASMTARPYNIERLYNDGKDKSINESYDFSMHPEVQIQFFM